MSYPDKTGSDPACVFTRSILSAAVLLMHTEIGSLSWGRWVTMATLLELSVGLRSPDMYGLFILFFPPSRTRSSGMRQEQTEKTTEHVTLNVAWNDDVTVSGHSGTMTFCLLLCRFIGGLRTKVFKVHDTTYRLSEVNGCQCVAQIAFTPPSDPNVFTFWSEDVSNVFTPCVNVRFFLSDHILIRGVSLKCAAVLPVAALRPTLLHKDILICQCHSWKENK